LLDFANELNCPWNIGLSITIYYGFEVRAALKINRNSDE
jgi:hypothetical protein